MWLDLAGVESKRERNLILTLHTYRPTAVPPYRL